MKSFFACVCIALCAMVTPATAAPRTLTVVADDWPPFSGHGLPDGGLSLDVIAQVLRRAGYQVETSVVPWARIMDGARSGEFDIVGSLFKDPDIASYMTYGDPFYTTQVQLVQRMGGSHAFTTVEALRPYSIAVGDGFVYEDSFDRADYLDKVVVTTTLQAVQMVAFGRVDLTLDSVDVVRHAIETEAPDLADAVEFAPGVLAEQGIHMAVRSDLDGSAEIVADFNAALAEMRADGTLAALVDKHVPGKAGG